MSTSAKIILDSEFQGSRLTTMEVTFHRFVLAEFNTHRVFSRNSASSRAIPVEKQLLRAINEPAFPVSLPSEQPGMSGGSELTWPYREEADDLLKNIYQATIDLIDEYLETHPEKSTRLHKSILNRPMEWFQYHTVIVTSSEWQNFFDQRCHEAAQPEIRVLAEMMETELNRSVPTQLSHGGWHMPYIHADDAGLEMQLLRKLSAARCARVSYMNHDGVRDIEADLRLFERLVSMNHWSPLEHVARAGGASGNLSGNFHNLWVQLRHLQ